MQIKTLAEILAESDSDSASPSVSKIKTSKQKNAQQHPYTSKQSSKLAVKANKHFITSNDANSAADNEDGIQTADQDSDNNRS
jgi:regulatory protein